MRKFDLLRSFLLSGLLCLGLWDAWIWLAIQRHRLPELHKEMLLGGFLIWFATICIHSNGDDDWAGEY